MLVLNLGCEASDAVATLLEWRERGGPDRVVGGSLGLAATGLGVWSAALTRA